MSIKASLFGAIIALSSLGNAYAAPVQLVTNGGFETGDFTGWTAVSNGVAGGCGTNVWVVNSTGTHGCNNNGTTVAAPTSGTYGAFNTFDGGAVNYTLSQKITVPGSLTAATLSFMDEFHMAYSGAARSFNVGFYDEAGTTLLGNVFTQTAGNSAIQAWTQQTVNVTALLASQAGKTINLRFTEVIPEAFTGPAGFGLDNISLTANVPEPGTMALMGLGMMGLAGLRRKRKNG
jgi:hypothetical protein